MLPSVRGFKSVGGEKRTVMFQFVRLRRRCHIQSFSLMRLCAASARSCVEIGTGCGREAAEMQLAPTRKAKGTKRAGKLGNHRGMYRTIPDFCRYSEV